MSREGEIAMVEYQDCQNCTRWAETHRATLDTLRAVVAPENPKGQQFLYMPACIVLGAVAATSLIHLLAKVKWG